MGIRCLSPPTRRYGHQHGAYAQTASDPVDRVVLSHGVTVLTQLLYLPVHLIQDVPKARFESDPPVVGEVAGLLSGFFEEHADVLQLHKLRLRHRWFSAPPISVHLSSPQPLPKSLGALGLQLLPQPLGLFLGLVPLLQ